MPPRRNTRPNDPPLVRMFAWLLRWRGLATLFWMLVSALTAALGLAWKFSPRLNALDGRTTAIEVHAALTDRKMDTLWTGQATLLLSACLDRTKTQQEMIRMTCPDSLYKGASP